MTLHRNGMIAGRSLTVDRRAPDATVGILYSTLSSIYNKTGYIASVSSNQPIQTKELIVNQNKGINKRFAQIFFK